MYTMKHKPGGLSPLDVVEAGKKWIALTNQEKGMGMTRMIQLSRLKRMKSKEASAVYEKDCEGENEVDGMKLANKGKCAEDGRIPDGWERRKVTRERRVDWYLRTEEGVIIRSQKQLDIYTQEHLLGSLSLKGAVGRRHQV